MARLSYLPPTKTSATPTELVVFVRELCQCIRERMRGTMRVRVSPSQGKLMLIFGDSLAGATVVHIRLGEAKAYGDAMTEMQISMRFPLIQLTMPDMAEALHMVGMLLNALDPQVINLGARDRETNPEVWARPPDDPDDPAPMARCDRIPNDTRQQRDASLNKHCILTDTRTYTPTEVFDWASATVSRIFDDLGSVVEATIYGVRVDRPSGVDLAGSEHRSRTVILDLSGKEASRVQILFLEGSLTALGQNSVVVPDLLHALHMAGMVAAGLGAKMAGFGNCKREKNEEILHKPLTSREKDGAMIRVDNFVAPNVDRIGYWK